MKFGVSLCTSSFKRKHGLASVFNYLLFSRTRLIVVIYNMDKTYYNRKLILQFQNNQSFTILGQSLINSCNAPKLFFFGFSWLLLLIKCELSLEFGGIHTINS